MKLAVTQELDIKNLKEELKIAFPRYQIRNCFFSTRTIRVTNGLSQVVVGQLKDNKMICVGNINISNPKILITFLLLLFPFLISAAIFLVLMMRLKKREFRDMEIEVASFLEKNYLV